MMAASSKLVVPQVNDQYGVQVRFGGGRDGNGINVKLAHRVRQFYRDLKPRGLSYLHEIRISEAAAARLPDGRYHLFWNNEGTDEQVPSDEMALLLREFVPQRRKLGAFWQPYSRRLFMEYEYEYGVLRYAYATQPVRGRPRAEILHPLFIRRGGAEPLRIGHITDIHVDVRADVYEENLRRSNLASEYPKRWKPDSYNNWNRSFVKNYDDAKGNSDIILLTGDLVDYGRGHWGAQGREHLGDDRYYHEDRNWFLLYYLLASGDAYRQPTYTILGNHDWRLNPYPPFAIAGAPNPNMLINNYGDFTEKEREHILKTAHGPRWDPLFSYSPGARGKAQLLLGAAKRVVSVTKNARARDLPGEHHGREGVTGRDQHQVGRVVLALDQPVLRLLIRLAGRAKGADARLGRGRERPVPDCLARRELALHAVAGGRRLPIPDRRRGTA